MIALKRLRRKGVFIKVPVTKKDAQRFGRYMDEKLRRSFEKAKKARGENFVDPRTIILD